MFRVTLRSKTLHWVCFNWLSSWVYRLYKLLRCVAIAVHRAGLSLYLKFSWPILVHRFESDIGDFRVTAAEHDVTLTEGVEQRRKITMIILHPNYDGRVAESGWLGLRTHESPVTDRVSSLSILHVF